MVTHRGIGVQLQGQARLVQGPEGWGLLDLESDDVQPVAAPDLVVLAGTRTARDDLFRALVEALPGTPIRRAGDALAPRGLRDAVAEGAAAGGFHRWGSGTPVPPPPAQHPTGWWSTSRAGVEAAGADIAEGDVLSVDGSTGRCSRASCW